ncbi:hypothetical protein [Arenimonas alkanexedens]
MPAVKSRKPERLLLSIVKGGLQPADGYTASRLRARGYRVGDQVLAVLTKPRNPKFHRLVHQFGQLLVENIDAFENLDGHRVLKRLQIEGGIACDEIPLVMPGIGPCSYKVPRSLSFESMDEGEFNETFRDFSRYVSKTYWPGMKPEQIEQMAGLMPDAA